MSLIADYPLPQATELPPALRSVALEPSRALVLIHNMQDDQLSPYHVDGPLLGRVLQHLNSLLQWAEQHQVPVLFSRQVHSGDAVPSPVTSALTPGASAGYLNKSSLSSFSDGQLLARMQAEQRDQLLLAGADAYGGALATAIAAVDQQLQLFVLADGLLANSAEEHQLTLNYVAQRCGQLLLSSRFDSEANQSAQLALCAWLGERVLALIDDEEQLDPQENLIFYGLDSLQVMKISAELKERGVLISFDQLARNPTLASWYGLIAQRLSGS